MTGPERTSFEPSCIGFTGIDGFGLLFQSISDEGGLMADLAQTPFSLPDVIEAVSMSAGATDGIATYVLRHAEAPEKGTSDENARRSQKERFAPLRQHGRSASGSTRAAERR